MSYSGLLPRNGEGAYRRTRRTGAGHTVAPSGTGAAFDAGAAVAPPADYSPSR